MKYRIPLITLAALVAVVFSACTQAADNTAASSLVYKDPPKNIIFFVGDGMGYNHVLLANYFEYGHEKAQPYEQEDWVQFALATFPAVTRYRDGEMTFGTGYNPRAAWQDPEYASKDYTDSGAGGTSLSTGVKTYYNTIGIGIYGDTLLHISQAAKALGKSIGVVSSVPLTHATPASFVVHNRDRRNYEELAHYMLFHSRIDLIMAPGHPDHDDDGRQAENNGRYIGGREIWTQLLANDGRTEFVSGEVTLRVQDANGDGNRDPWTLVQDREEFLSLASGKVPSRVLGIPRVASTLQQGRTKGDNEVMPFSQPFNENVPSLEEMTLAALHVLSRNPGGFFVMIEGGAIDWASHDNHTGRTIEEQIDFNRSVAAAIAWVEANSNWNETLIIVTSDHETGYLTGPEHPEKPYAAVSGNGKGQLPNAKWNFGNHTNTLVPFYAKGRGAELFAPMADEKDPVRGPYLQNTDPAQAIFMMWGRPEVIMHRLSY